LYNSGSVAVIGENQVGFEIGADYHQSTDGKLEIDLGSQCALTVDGIATIDGELSVNIGQDFKRSPGETIAVIEANRISGKFSNPNDTVIASDSIRFSIEYSDTAVTLRMK